MADNKTKTDRKDEQTYDKSEVNNTYEPEVGGAGGQAEGTASPNDEDFYADEGSK